MSESKDRNIDQGVEDSINLFKRAKVGEVAPVTPRRPANVLLALDGSAQDTSGIALAGDLHERLGSAIHVVDARDDTPYDRLAHRTAESLDANAISQTEGESFEQILAATSSSESELLILPCPFGRDLDSVGPDSAGTVIDVLLARSPVPILVVRKPFAGESRLFHQVRFVLTSENEAARSAAEWAIGITAPSGQLEMVLVLEKEFRENVRLLMESIAPDVDVGAESLTDALAQAYARLHRGLQKAANESGIPYRLEIRQEESDPLMGEDETPRPLIVLALERSDHSSQGNVQERIRLSHHPVLVVPTQAKLPAEKE